MDQQILESWIPPVYVRTPRNAAAYRATSKYCCDRLEHILALYRESTNDQQTLRLIRDDIDNILRRYHGYCIKEKIDAHYIEVGADKHVDFEHLIPAAKVRDGLIAGVFTINEALNCPTVRLSRDKHRHLKETGWASQTPDMWRPFRRYSQVFNAQYQTHDGTAVDPETWTLADHYRYFQHLIL